MSDAAENAQEARDATEGGGAARRGKLPLVGGGGPKEPPPWEPLYEAWKQAPDLKGETPSWFVFHPSCRKYWANFALWSLLAITAVWAWFMGVKGYPAWQWMAMIALFATAACHLLFALATLVNRRVFEKMKVLAPHLILVIVAVVVGAWVFFGGLGQDRQAASRPALQWLVSAVAVVYGAWVLALIAWRRIGVKYELRSMSLIELLGILRRVEEETPLVRVNDVGVTSSFTQRLLGLCTVNVTSTDPGDVNQTDPRLRTLLGVSEKYGVLELTDIPRQNRCPTQQETARLKAVDPDLPEKLLDCVRVDDRIERRMHWIREHRMVVVDSGN